MWCAMMLLRSHSASVGFRSLRRQTGRVCLPETCRIQRVRGCAVTKCRRESTLLKLSLLNSVVIPTTE
ncbi:hypothetical protein AWC29_12870 [Mycobacterium triplex]|uniref:Secreted protein n=1 Tax=Mycobacterium triplex TaxID=47839 RepID=A0ABX3W5Y2_9MYCO|nr:hypothetical protein AWC29_12870 [Mycobacterium triplex]